MATSKSVETLHSKVDQLITAFDAQLSDIETLREENQLLKLEIEKLQNARSKELENSSAANKEYLTKRIDVLVKEVDKCMELLER
ncbi:MAG: hypothetical protein KDC83_10970 [Flavobacteriales bacterium]|nr:hypothetical protein [Flavobacteriales bacterium]